jgi:N-acetylglutamate synthase-like GNAT family acetyltransferase
MISFATEDDARGIAECLIELNKDFVQHFNISEAERYLKYYPILISRENEEITGVCVLNGGHDYLEIEALAVHKNHQKKGIGTKLMEATEKLALQNNFESIRALSYAFYNVKPFYLKHGFETNDDGKHGYLFIKKLK